MVFVVVMAARVLVRYWEFLQDEPQYLSLGGFVLLSILSIGVLASAIMAATAVSIIVMHVGLASSFVPTGSSEITPMAEWYVWHLAETIPLLNLPESLNWKLNTAFDDSWTGSLLLLLRILLVATLIFPIQLAVRISKRRWLRNVPPQLDACQRFSRSLNEAQLYLNQAEQLIVSRSSGLPNGQSIPFHGIIMDLESKAANTIDRLRKEYGAVVALFGVSEVSVAASSAIKDLDNCVNILQLIMFSVMEHGVSDARLANLTEAQKAANQSQKRYEGLIRDALRIADENLST
jgi:hypothetical protein